MNYAVIAVLSVACLVLLGLWLGARKPQAAVREFVERVEDRVESELQSVITKAELRLTDTTSEDAAIAAATRSKAQKRAALEQHVKNLQAHLDGTAAAS